MLNKTNFKINKSCFYSYINIILLLFAIIILLSKNLYYKNFKLNLNC